MPDTLIKPLKATLKVAFFILALLASLPILAAAATTTTTTTTTTNQPTDSLQQQLQTLQQSIQSSSNTTPVAAAPATVPLQPAQQTAPDPAQQTAPAANLPAPGTDLAATSASTDQPAPTTSPEASGADLRDQAFGRMLNTTLPLSPAQILLLRNLYDATQKAAVTYPGVPPRPTASSIPVNLAPGATPPVVRLSAGFVTSLVFVDSTGAPWPIDSYSLGNPTAFNIQWDKKSNILLVQAITAHRMGNLAVILKGLNTPVMIDLNPGQAAMDVRVDLRIPGLGPEAKPTYSSLPGTESPALLALLDGIPPPGAKALTSSACDNCAWLVGDKLYLRTQFTVLSPAWISTLSSADGTHVYEMEPTPLILTSYNGKTVKMRIEGF